MAALREVAERGAPAQAAQARRLLADLQSDPLAAAAALELIDAYLNDPYLTR